MEREHNFCYHGDMLCDRGYAELAVLNRIKIAGLKFRELASILRNRDISTRVKRQVYDTCVRSCLIYGSETWALII